MILQTIHHQLLFNIHANSKSHLHIFGTDHEHFGKWSKKMVRFPTEKRIRTQSRQTSVYYALFASLIEGWLIYHTVYEFNDFGSKRRIDEISKNKTVDKNIFARYCSSDY